MADRAQANVSLSQDLHTWIEEIVAQSGYDTASDYLRDLVRADLKRRLRDQIDEELQKALKSPTILSTPQVWSNLNDRVRSHSKNRRKRRAA